MVRVCLEKIKLLTLSGAQQHKRVWGGPVPTESCFSYSGNYTWSLPYRLWGVWGGRGVTYIDFHFLKIIKGPNFGLLGPQTVAERLDGRQLLQTKGEASCTRLGSTCMCAQRSRRRRAE